MRDISNLEKDVTHLFGKITDRLVEIQKEAAINIMNDAKMMAPGTGEYSESIKVSETKVTENSIETEIYTDAVVSTKDGTKYNLGYLLENGTLQHAIPNAFGLGYTYGYTDKYGKWHKGTMDEDWHPGFDPIPHFIPALEKNKFNYKKNVIKAMLKGGK